MSRLINNSDVARLHEYKESTLAHFRPRFAAYAPRFATGEALLARLSAAICEVIARGREHFHKVDEAHNELCVADAVLADPSTVDATLFYESRLPNTDKTIDFSLREADGRLTLIDVKTIKPRPRERWEQYRRAIKEGWLPQNVELILEQEWQGGELWHTAFASRSRFLEYTLELEAKIASASYGDAVRRKILMLCGEGFHWCQDELEDFVAYYRTARHRGDDPFALAEARHLKDKKLSLQRSISSFGCLDRRQGDIQARRINWHVQSTSPQSGLSSAF